MKYFQKRLANCAGYYEGQDLWLYGPNRKPHGRSHTR
jgi:hypothetical protein